LREVWVLERGVNMVPNTHARVCTHSHTYSQDFQKKALEESHARMERQPAGVSFSLSLLHTSSLYAQHISFVSPRVLENK